MTYTIQDVFTRAHEAYRTGNPRYLSYTTRLENGIATLFFGFYGNDIHIEYKEFGTEPNLRLLLENGTPKASLAPTHAIHSTDPPQFPKYIGSGLWEFERDDRTETVALPISGWTRSKD